MKVLKSNKLLIALLTIVFIFMISAFGLSFLGKKAHAIEGDGSKENPYIIEDVDDLLEVKGFCNHHGGYLEKHFKLMNDITLEPDSEFKSFFFEYSSEFGEFQGFIGSFDGNGKTISGLTQSSNFFSLFGAIGKGSVVKDLGLINCDISLSNRIESQPDYIGALANINYGTIENCYVTGEISSDTGAGGLVGENYGIIKDSYNESTVSGDLGVGGIAGINGGTNKTPEFSGCEILNCYNTGNVSGSDGVGGIVGENIWEVTNCYNTGAINGSNNVGGIVGVNNCEITNCYNTGDIIGSACVGGIVGLSGSNSKITICFNSADIKGNTEVGGIAGYSNSEIKNCYNTGDIEATENAGGIAGINGSGTVSNCYSTAKFLVANDPDGDGCYKTIGGIIGVNNGTAGNSYFNSQVAGSGICDIGGLKVMNNRYLATSTMTFDEVLEHGHAMENLQNDGVWEKRPNDGSNLYYPELAVFYNTEASKESVGTLTEVQVVDNIWFEQSGTYEYTYGQKLDDLNLAKEEAYSSVGGSRGNVIKGTFAFENGDDVPKVATYTVNILFTPNDGSATVRFMLFIVVKKAQAIAPTPFPGGALEAKVGDKLSGVSLEDYFEDYIYFKWEDPDFEFKEVGEIKVSAIYNPNPDNYISDRIPLTINVVAAEPIAIEKPTIAELVFTYNGSEQGPAIVENEFYSLSGDINATNVKEYTLTITVKSGYKWADDENESFDVSWEIKKATPEVDFSDILEGELGSLLSTVNLSAGFEWADGDIKLNACGTFEYDAFYNPDKDNYNTVELKIKVTVAQVIEGIRFTQSGTYAYTYGQVLTNDLLAGEKATRTGGEEVEGTFTFKTANVKPNVGTVKVAIIFTPNDGSDAVEFELSITMAKAQAVVPTTLPSGFEAKVGDSLSSISLANYAGFKWETPDSKFDKAGEIKVWVLYNTDSANYNDARVEITIKVIDQPSSPGLNATQISLMVSAIALVVLGAILMIVFIARRRRQKQG